MGERYSRLFSLPENLYAIGSPVVIAAGTLLKDSQTGKIVAQLKLRSISDKSIKAVKVKFDLFDTAGNPVGESLIYNYLDLSASRGSEFAQKTPVMVSNTIARSYTVSVAEVVFEDRTIWIANGERWDPLNKPSLLDFDDVELRKQYEIRFGNNSAYIPMEEKDLWCCTCGEWNHTGENCHVCGCSLFELQSLDMAELEAQKVARLTEEARQSSAKKAAADVQKQKNKKIQKIVISVVCSIVVILVLLITVIIPTMKYNNAVSLMEEGKYKEAIAAFEAMNGYKDSDVQIENAIAAAENGKLEDVYRTAEALAESGETAQAAIAFGKLGEYKNATGRCMELWSQVKNLTTIDAGVSHTVALCSDGTVVATGENENSQCNVGDWTDIVSVSAGGYHTVGLCSDGTVVAVGATNDGRCNVSGWTDIIAISAGGYHTVGLRSDGTVVAIGYSEDGQCNVSSWTDIVAISAGRRHTVGLRSDGTVVSVGDWGKCNPNGWANIVSIHAGGFQTIGLHSDGTVKCGYDSDNLYNVSDWMNIVAVSAHNYHTVGLQADGTVVTVGDNEYGKCNVNDWVNIVAVSAGNHHTVGLRADGTVIAVGNNESSQCSTSSWKNVKLPN